MKIIRVKPGEALTFIGANFLLRRHGLALAYVPEILRGLASSSWSVSREILTHGIESTKGAIAAYSSFIARAVAMPNIGYAWNVREYYKSVAAGYTAANHKCGVNGDVTVCADRDISIKFNVPIGSEFAIYREVEKSESYYDWMYRPDVDELIQLTCGAVQPDEELQFAAWNVTRRTDSEVLGNFPASWRHRLRASPAICLTFGK